MGVLGLLGLGGGLWFLSTPEQTASETKKESDEIAPEVDVDLGSENVDATEKKSGLISRLRSRSETEGNENEEEAE